VSKVVVLQTSIDLCRGRKGSRQLRKANPHHDQASRPEPGRIPRVARLIALALKFDTLLRDHVVADLAALARLGQLSRARISQIMNLTCLATHIQEDILFLPRTFAGHDAIKLADLQQIALEADWQRQRELWQRLKTTRHLGA
jgi:hypothetical protein